MRLCLSGQKAFGAHVLEALLDAGHDVALVFCPKPDGDKRDRLHNTADRRRVPVYHGLTSDKLPDDLDLIIAAHSWDYISPKSLDKTVYGGIGYHPSLLPLHRGRDAVRWAVKMGDKVTGGSVYWLTQNVDGGPIAAQDFCFIQPDDDAMTLWRRDLAPMGVHLILKVLDDLEAGKVVKIPQDNSVATWEPSIDRPPLFRPELPRLPGPGAVVHEFIVEKEYLKGR